MLAHVVCNLYENLPGDESRELFRVPKVIGDLVERVAAASEGDIDALVADYQTRYTMGSDLKTGTERHDAVRYSARLELGLRKFLDEGGFKGFTTTFEDLHGLRQLPGMAVQRLMAVAAGGGGRPGGGWPGRGPTG